MSNSGVVIQTWPKFSGGSTVKRRPPLKPVESLFTESPASQTRQAGGVRSVVLLPRWLTKPDGPLPAMISLF